MASPVLGQQGGDGKDWGASFSPSSSSPKPSWAHGLAAHPDGAGVFRGARGCWALQQPPHRADLTAQPSRSTLPAVVSFS